MKLQANQFLSESKKVNKSLGSIQKQITGLKRAAGAALALAGLNASLQSLVASTEKLGDTANVADRLGANVERLQELQFAASQTGTTVETLNMAMQRMTRRVAEAAKGTGEARDAIKELGLDASRLSGMRADQQMITFADALSKVANQSDRVRLAMKLFDSEGVKLVNTLQGGKTALDEFAQSARSRGLVRSADEIEKARKSVDEYNASVASLEAAWTKAGPPIINVLSKIAALVGKIVSADMEVISGLGTIIMEGGFGKDVARERGKIDQQTRESLLHIQRLRGGTLARVEQKRVSTAESRAQTKAAKSTEQLAEEAADAAKKIADMHRAAEAAGNAFRKSIETMRGEQERQRRMAEEAIIGRQIKQLEDRAKEARNQLQGAEQTPLNVGQAATQANLDRRTVEQFMENQARKEQTEAQQVLTELQEQTQILREALQGDQNPFDIIPAG